MSAPYTNSLEARLPDAAAREESLYARFRELGLAWKTFSHPPVFTVAESRALCASIPGQHTKNLFLQDKKGGLWMVVAREGQRIDLNALAKVLGCPRFSFGSAEVLVGTLGIAPGSVTPFALLNDRALRVSPVLDEKMMQSGILNFHPLRNDRTSAITPENLLKFIRACGHAPRILPLPEAAS